MSIATRDDRNVIIAHVKYTVRCANILHSSRDDNHGGVSGRVASHRVGRRRRQRRIRTGDDALPPSYEYLVGRRPRPSVYITNTIIIVQTIFDRLRADSVFLCPRNVSFVVRNAFEKLAA